MENNQFFEKKGPFHLIEILNKIRCENDISKKNDLTIHGLESLENASKNDMTFLHSSKYQNYSSHISHLYLT